MTGNGSAIYNWGGEAVLIIDFFVKSGDVKAVSGKFYAIKLLESSKNDWLFFWLSDFILIYKGFDLFDFWHFTDGEFCF